MIPVRGIEEISKSIFERYEFDECITFGILIADYRQDEARQYIINYLDMFDQRSGKYIDFYIPGYYQYSDDFVSDYTKQYHSNMEVRSDKCKRLISGWIPSIHCFSYNDW